MNWEVLFSTLVGAVAGSGTILIVELIRHQHKRVAELNFALATITVLLETLLSFKKEQTKPLIENYRKNRDAFVNNRTDERLQVSVTRLSPINMEVSITPDQLQAIGKGDPILIQTYQRLIRDLRHLDANYANWNKITIKVNTLSALEFHDYYFGSKVGNKTNTEFQDSLSALETYIDGSIQEANIMKERLDKHANKMFKYWRKKIVRIDLLPEYADLIPKVDQK